MSGENLTDFTFDLFSRQGWQEQAVGLHGWIWIFVFIPALRCVPYIPSYMDSQSRDVSREGQSAP